MNRAEIFHSLSRDLNLIINSQGMILDANDECYYTLGWFTNELQEKPFLDFVHPKDKEEVNAVLTEILAVKITHQIEFRFLHADGTYLYCEWRGTVGELGVYFLGRDITDSKRNKLFLERSQQMAKVGGWEIDLSTYSVHWTKETHRILGTAEDSFIPTIENSLLFFAEESKPLIKKAITNLISTGKTFTIKAEVLNVKNELLSIRLIGEAEFNNGKAIKIVGTFKDITKTYDLEITKERFQLCLKYFNICSWIWDIRRDQFRIENNIFERYGSTKSLFLNAIEVWKSIVHPDDLEFWLVSIERAVSNEVPFDISFRILLPNKTIRYIKSSGYIERDLEGGPLRMYGLSWDITEEVEAKRKLESQRLTILEEKEKFESIVNNLPLMISFFNKEGEFTWVNPRWESCSGWSFEEMRSKDMLAEFFPDEKINEEIKRFMFSGRKDWMDMKIRKKDGSYIETSWTNVKLSSGETIGIGMDISLRKEQEKLIKEQQVKIIQSAKLSSLGEMSSGIAHEINNPLTIIHGKTAMISYKLQQENFDKEEILEDIKKIEKTSERIAKIIRGLKTFSRSGEKDPFEFVSLREILNETLEMCHKRFLSHNIQLHVKGAEDFFIECRQTQISQVLLNFLNNSFDAISESIGSWIEIDFYSNSEANFIIITDSGPGIPPEVTSKMLEPFFTTKPPGKGTGLGLSISKGIIEEHNGKLMFDKTCKNTRFIITLPLVKVNSKVA